MEIHILATDRETSSRLRIDFPGEFVNYELYPETRYAPGQLRHHFSTVMGLADPEEQYIVATSNPLVIDALEVVALHRHIEPHYWTRGEFGALKNTTSVEMYRIYSEVFMELERLRCVVQCPANGG